MTVETCCFWWYIVFRQVWVYTGCISLLNMLFTVCSARGITYKNPEPEMLQLMVRVPNPKPQGWPDVYILMLDSIVNNITVNLTLTLNKKKWHTVRWQYEEYDKLHVILLSPYCPSQYLTLRTKPSFAGLLSCNFLTKAATVQL